MIAKAARWRVIPGYSLFIGKNWASPLERPCSRALR
jgi:hypothetical protein